MQVLKLCIAEFIIYFFVVVYLNFIFLFLREVDVGDIWNMKIAVMKLNVNTFMKEVRII